MWDWIIAVVSDLHCNSTVGLCPREGIQRDDGDYYMPSKAQIWQWERWEMYWAEVAQTVKDTGALLIEVFNGDGVDGDHHGTRQIATRNMKTQHNIARGVLEVPLALDPHATFIIRGTGSHVGEQAENEEAIAEEIGAEPCPDVPGRFSTYERKIELCGKLFTFKHHGRTGYRPWTKQSAIGLLAEDIWVRHMKAGERPPDVAIRSHVHQYADSGPGTSTRAITTNPWQLKTMFGEMVAAEAIPSIGGLIIKVGSDGTIDVKSVKYQPTLPKVWRP